MQTTRGQFHPTRFEDLAVTVEFHCNSACTFCIVQEGMNRFKGVPFERFQQIVEENKASGKYGRVIFTGGEVTLEKSLPQFVRYARDSGAFDHVRVQTNARRLEDMELARALVDDGIDEFFVSLHGADAAVQDGISQRPGSFDETIRGLENLRALGVRIMTNTVICRDNVHALPPLVDLAARFGAVRMEFWNYLPMEDHADERDLIAPLTDAIPGLVVALDKCRALGIEAVTKYFPRCLLGDHGETLDNSQADVIIVESFWNEFPRFNCLYEAECEHSADCLGLHHDYVTKFGWEEDRLRPVPRTTPWEDKDDAVRGRAEAYGGEKTVAFTAAGHPAWEALAANLPSQIARLRGVELTRNQARYRYEMSRGGVVDVVLAARDDAQPALARTRSFNVFYTKIEGAHQEVELQALLRGFVLLVGRRDDGSLTLDARKGLTEIRRARR